MNLDTILSLLPKVGPIIADATEFKRLIDELVASFDTEREQALLQEAYDRAIVGAANAHDHLQQAVARGPSG